MGRVRIGTCSGPAEAALVRAAFEAHEIAFVINAEQHASMLGGLGGPFVPLHVLVDEADAEEASALLADLQQGRDDDDDDELAEEAAAAAPPDADEDDARDDVGERVANRRRTGVVMLLAMCVTFGTAHMYSGAWLRGVGLALLEVFAITRTVNQPTLGIILLVGCIVTDLVGALWLVKPRTTVPTARVVR